MASFCLAIVTTFNTMLLVTGIKVLSLSHGFIYLALPSLLMIILTYISCDGVPRLYKVPVPALTVPEDHLRRAKHNKLLSNAVPYYTQHMVARNMPFASKQVIDEIITRVLLETAIQDGNNILVKKLLKTKINVCNGGFSFSGPLIHAAIIAGNYEIFNVSSIKSIFNKLG